jgi:phosphoglycerate dehydrogenase-like enzyme
VAPRRDRAEWSRGPQVLFFSQDGDVADVYRAHCPAGWRFSALQDRGDEQEKLRLLADADVVIQTDTLVTRTHLEAAPHLVLVQRQGVGVDAIDVAALRDHQVALAICPAGTAESVAEHTLMLMLAAGRHLVPLHQAVTTGGAWPKWDYRLRSLGFQGATVGIVGFGRIGQAVAHRVLAFGSTVLVNQRRPQPLGEEWDGSPVELCPDLDELFARSDVVTLHCPLLPENRGMVDQRRLALMQPHAVLVNTARGALVVEPDLVEALRAGRPGAAGLDVLVDEPPAPDNPLLALPNVVVTPHCGAGTRQSQTIKAQSVFANIRQMWEGEPLEDRLL